MCEYTKRSWLSLSPPPNANTTTPAREMVTRHAKKQSISSLIFRHRQKGSLREANPRTASPYGQFMMGFVSARFAPTPPENILPEWETSPRTVCMAERRRNEGETYFTAKG